MCCVCIYLYIYGRRELSTQWSEWRETPIKYISDHIRDQLNTYIAVSLILVWVDRKIHVTHMTLTFFPTDQLLVGQLRYRIYRYILHTRVYRTVPLLYFLRSTIIQTWCGCNYPKQVSFNVRLCDGFNYKPYHLARQAFSYYTGFSRDTTASTRQENSPFTRW